MTAQKRRKAFSTFSASRGVIQRSALQFAVKQTYLHPPPAQLLLQLIRTSPGVALSCHFPLATWLHNQRLTQRAKRIFTAGAKA